MILKNGRTVKTLKPSESAVIGFQARGIDLAADTASTIAAVVDSENLVAETGETNNTALRQINGVDLSGQWSEVHVDGPKKEKYVIKAKYSLGSDMPTGAFLLRIYLSSDGNLDAGDTLLLKKAKKIKKLQGGKPVKGRLQSKIGHDPSGEYLILEIDAENDISETSEVNNIIVYLLS